MWDNPDRGELNLAEGARRRRQKKSPSVLSCISKRREGCDRSSEVETVHSGRRGRASSFKRTKGIWQRREL